MTISFRLDANCPQSISKGRDFSHVLCIKGANGSGKTQILKALAFLSHFCSSSFSNSPDEQIGISPFFDSKEPSQFFVEFKIEDILYRYEVESTDEEVIRETLFQTKARRTKLFERLGTKLTVRSKSLQALDKLKLRKNASIISTAHQYELGVLEKIHGFFNDIYCNVHMGGLREEPLDIGKVCKLLTSHQPVFDFVRKFIRECDVGISDIHIGTFKNREGKEELFPIFIHTNAGKDQGVIDNWESSGTKMLFRNLAAYFLTLGKGGLLVVDEFDMNLHPHILPKLVNLFLSSETNRTDAQFLFTTHDSEILNLLGRYRTYLVEKEDNESFAYRLDEIPGDLLRNDRPIRPIYIEGRIGGVPKL